MSTVSETALEKLHPRRRAELLGEETYVTGRPCSRGFIAPRRTVSAKCTCSGCAEHSAKRKMEKYRENPEPAKKMMRESHARHREARNLQKREHGRTTKEEIRLRNRRYYLQNKDALKDSAKSYRDSNRDELNAKTKERSRRHYLENKDHYSLKFHKRRAAKINATPKWYGEMDDFVMSEARDLCAERERLTGIKWSVDHIIPLSAKKASGLHCAHNIQVMPLSLNIAKHNRLKYTETLDWLKSA